MSKSPIRLFQRLDIGLDKSISELTYTDLINYAVQIISTIVPLVLVGVPLLFFVWTSFWSTIPGRGGHFTLDGYRQILEIPQAVSMFYNTVVVIVFGTIIAVFLGVGVALLVNKFDTPGTEVVSYLLIIQYILPSIIVALSWSLIAGPQGFINETVQSLGLSQGPIINVHNEWGIALALGVHYAGLVYLLVNGAIASIPSSMEESARVWGANPYHVLKRVTLSLSFPSILVAAIIVAALVAQNFGGPLMLGLPSGTYVISTFIYIKVARFPTNFAVASALGVILILLIVLALIGQWYIKGSSEGYQTIVGQGTEDTQVSLSLSKRAQFLTGGLTVAIGGIILLPIAYLVFSSFLNAAVGIFSQYSYLTLEHYLRFLVGSRSAAFWSALLNTFFIATVGSFLSMVIASLISYVIVKGKTGLSTLLDIIMLAPIAIPIIILGVAYLWFFITYDVLNLYGSVWVIIIAIASREIVYGTRAANSSLRSIGDSLEEVAQLSGANLLTILRRVYYPLIRPGFAAGFVIAFTHYFKAFTIPILLRESGFHVLSTLMFQSWRNGHISEAVTIATITAVIIVTVVALIQSLTDVEITSLS